MPTWLLVGYILLVPSFSQTKSCTGPERNAIQAVLNDVNWETLADQLNLQDQVADIQDNCYSKTDRRPCYFREIVSRYIQSQPDESCDNTRRKIMKALGELRYVNEASRLMGLKLDSPLDHSDYDSSNETPSTISDEAVETTRGLIKEHESEFGAIVLRAHEDMKENEVDGGQLRLSLVNLPVDLSNKLDYFKKEIRNNLIAATSVDDIFFIISDYWDFLNYFLLEHIIDRHASEKVREKMAKYVKKIRVFRRITKLQIFSKAHERIPRKVGKQFHQMVTEHDMDWDTATLEDIDKFRNDVDSELSLSKFALHIYKVTRGSVEITWLVPESLVTLIQKSIKPSSLFLRNHNVTKITIDGRIVYDNATENRESSTVELIKSAEISILVSVVIIVQTTLILLCVTYKYSLRQKQPDKRQDQIGQASQQETQLPIVAPGKLLYGPSLPELVRLKIPQHVGINYIRFGVLLLNDNTGSRVMSLDQECQRNPERIVLKILEDWLNGKGVPVTWKSLIEVLRHIELKELADQIEQASHQKEVEPQLLFVAPERPTLPQLLHLEIPQHVCDHNFEFGVHLLNDHKGSRIKRLKECLEDPEDVALMILQDWIKGNGVPVTWESLIKVLRHIELKELADQIEQASQHKEIMTQPIKQQSPLAGPSQPAGQEKEFEFLTEECSMEDYSCPICCEVVRNPYQLLCCGYNYCYNCIRRLHVEKSPCPQQSSHESRSIRKCPTCRGKFCENCMERNACLYNDLKKLKVKCRYHNDGCKWSGRQLNSKEHEREECRFVPNPKPTEEREDVVPVKRILHNFSDIKKDHILEVPFYTHDGGYKMHLWVFPNGYGKEEGKYMSVFTCLVKGENDDKLEWPLRGSITVQLLDQSGKGNHLERKIHYTNRYNNTYSGRVMHSGRSEGVWPDKPFLACEALFGESCDYLRNDCLKFRISKCKVQSSWRKIIAFVVVIFFIFIFSYFSYFTNKF